MHAHPFVFALMLLLAPAVAAADAWDQFRGAGARGVSGSPGVSGANGIQGDSGGSVPTRWGDEENLAWKTELPGAGSSSPVVMGNRIFLTAYSGYGMSVEEPGEKDALQLHVLSLSLDDGQLLWDRTVDPSPDEQPMGKRIGEHGFATPTPCLDQVNVYASFVANGDKLFLATRDAGVVVLAAKPYYEELAVNRLGDRQERFNATPAISGGKLLLRSDKAIYCVADRSTR